MLSASVDLKSATCPCVHRQVAPFAALSRKCLRRSRRAGLSTLIARYETDAETAAALEADIEDRVDYICTEDDLIHELEKAGDSLVVLEVMAEQTCETGHVEPNDGWTPDQDEVQQRKLAKCTQIKHNFVRMAADSPDVRFLAMLNTDLDSESKEFSERLGVETFPTVIFFKNNRILWTSSGSTHLEGDMREGVLYFGNTAGANSVKASEHVADLTSRADLDAFLAGSVGADEGPDALQCVVVTTPFCSPCVHVYPSIVTLAMNFHGVVSFGRLMDDETPEMQEVFKSLGILEVPTFITFQNGKEVARCVSGNKGDLIGHILEVAAIHGIAAPAPAK